jgi:hypothetical protein
MRRLRFSSKFLVPLLTLVLLTEWPAAYGGSAIDFDGVYMMPSEVACYETETLELSRGNFRYWHWTHMPGKTRLNYPLQGKYEVSEGRLILQHPEIYVRERLILKSHENITLWREPASLEQWKREGNASEYSVLIRVQVSPIDPAEPPEMLSLADISAENARRVGYLKDPMVKLIENANNWSPGNPIPEELYRYRSRSVCQTFPDDTRVLLQEISNYDLLLALLLDSRTEQAVFDNAVEQAIVLGGPRRLFTDLASRYRADANLSSDRHQRLKERMGHAHALVEAVSIGHGYMTQKEARRVLEEFADELRNGRAWDDISQSIASEHKEKRVNQYGGIFEISKVDVHGRVLATKWRNLSPTVPYSIVPESHIDQILSANEGDILLLEDNEFVSGPRRYLWRVIESHPGVPWNVIGE